MDLAPEDLRHRLHQLQFLATETDDPLAERLIQDLIVELEDRLTAEPSPVIPVELHLEWTERRSSGKFRSWARVSDRRAPSAGPI